MDSSFSGLSNISTKRPGESWSEFWNRARQALSGFYGARHQDEGRKWHDQLMTRLALLEPYMVEIDDLHYAPSCPVSAFAVAHSAEGFDGVLSDAQLELIERTNARDGWLSRWVNGTPANVNDALEDERELNAA